MAELQDRALTRQVRDALVRLHDPVYLQTHGLAKALAQQVSSAPRPSQIGALLRQQLVDAIETLRPQGTAGDRAWRAHRIMQLRYVDGLDATDVQGQIGLAKTQYYREHERALATVASVIGERLSAQPATGEPQGGEDAGSAAKPARTSNLPAALTSFVGRVEELEEVKRLLAAGRLVTLTGAGGSGKTRLALEAARQLLERYPEGVWLIDLAGVSDGRLVAHTLAYTLGLRDEPRQPVQATLINALASREVLLVLDNCEHLIDACAQLAAAMLRSCPRVRILATSREVLNVGGEEIYRVPPLATPPEDDATAALDLRQYESVRLFVERATASVRDFALAEHNAPAVAQVCRRLDGIPLAIELAAARVGILSPVQIAERLDDRFRLLTGGQRSLPARHQTLRALVDWSYELLAESEVMLLQRLSVFAGGWTLEAAEAVCGADGIEVAEVLDLLGQLVAKSLVLADDVPGQGYRYRMLETMREYGQERLAASGRARAFEDAHARYYLSLAEQAEPALRGPDQLHCYAHVDMEHDNFRAALVRLRAWAEEDPSAAATGLRIAERLAWYWYVRSYWNEGRDWLGYFIALAPAEGTVAARARANAAVLSWLVGDRETANAWQHESVALARATGNESAVAWCLLMLLPILFLMGDFARIEETASEAIPIFLAHDAAWETGFSTSIRGAAKVYTGDAAAGLQMIKEALELFQRSGDRWGIGYAYTHLGLAATAGKNAEQARQLLRQSVTSFEELGHKGSTTEPLARLGKLAFEQGDVHGAAREYLEALRLANEIGRRQAIGACLAGLAAIAAARGQSEEAVWLYQAAEACRQTVDVKLSPADREAEDRALANLREALGPDAFERAASQGQTMPLQEAVAVGEQVGHAAE